MNITPFNTPLPLHSEADRLDQLLPIIRIIRKRRSFKRDKAGHGVAVFREEIFIFSARRNIVFPERLFVDDDGAELQRHRQIKIRKRFPLQDIKSIRVTRSEIFALISGVTGTRKRFSFTVPLVEAGHLIEVLATLLGSRMICEITSTDLAPIPHGRNWITKILGAVLLLITGICFILLGWHQLQNPDSGMSLMLLHYGSLLSIFGAIYLGQKAFPLVGQKRAAGRAPFRSAALAFVCKIIGALLIFAAQFLSVLLENELFSSRSSLDFSLQVEQGLRAGTLSLLISCIGAILLYIGYRIGLSGVLSVYLNDNKPLAIYLRSFGDDGKNNLNPDTSASKILGLREWGLLEKLGPIANLYPMRLLKLVLGSAFDTAEEQLAAFFRRRGHFVALGKPGEIFATAGASRMYVTHEIWQEKVLELLACCSCVVVQPARSEGVWWEIEACLKQMQPGCILLSFAAFEKSLQAYEEFRLRFEKLLGSPLPKTLGADHFVWINPQGRAELLPSRYRSPFVWPLVGVGLDIKQTLSPFVNYIYPKNAIKASRRVNPFLFAASEIGAIMLWFSIIYGSSFLINCLQINYSILAATIEPATEVYTGRYAPYHFRLAPSWLPDSPPLGVDRMWSILDRVAVVSIGIEENRGGGIKEMEELVFRQRNQALGWTTRELSRRNVVRDDREWLELTVCTDIPGALFDQYQVINLHADPHWNVCISAAMSTVNTALFPSQKQVLARIADGFIFPLEQPQGSVPARENYPPLPPSKREQTLEQTPYELQLAAGWQSAPSELQRGFPGGKLFSYGNGEALFGIIMEPSLPKNLEPQRMAELIRSGVASRGAKNTTINDIGSIKAGNRNWIQFRLTARNSEVELTFFYRIYPGNKATCTTVFWTETKRLEAMEVYRRQIFDGLRIKFE